MDLISRQPEKKRDNTKAQIIFSSILLMLDTVIEFYTIVNYPKNIIAVGVFGIIAIVFLYVLITAILQAGYNKEEERREQYENLFKSEKASYLLLRKSFDDLERRMELMERNIKVPTDEIINAQKAVAKITINRSRENAEAVLNASDQLSETLDELQNQINQVNNEIQSNQKTILSKSSQEILMKQQELMTGLKEMQVELQRDMMNVMSKAAAAPTPVVMQAPVMTQPVVQAVPNVDAFASASAKVEEPVSMPSVEELLAEAEAEPSVEELLAGDAFATEEALSEEPMVEEVLEAVTEELVLDEIAEEPVIEEAVEAVAEEPVMEEPAVEEVVEAIAEEPVMEEAVEAVAEEPVMEEAVEAVAEEPVVEEATTPDMPDLSDPGHVMTPEEIAAMISNSDKIKEMDSPVFTESTEDIRNEAPVDENGLTELEKAVEAELAKMDPDPATEEVVTQEMGMEEEIVAQEIEEEKPPMPDLSDPNKVMTPEEIAALIANM